MEYIIKPFTQNYFESFAKLLIDNFEFENKDKRASVGWKFFHPFHKQKTITYVALFNNEIVSQYSNIPYPVSYHHQLYRSLLCADMATDSNHRGKKLIHTLSTKVYEEVHKQKYDFSIGFSNDEGVLVDTYAKNYGYKIVGKYVRYFKILLYKSKTPGITLVQVKQFDPSWIDHNTEFLHVQKTYAFLNWRYVQKPHNTYSIFEMRNGNDLLGYVVTRKHLSILYVYDFILCNYDEETIRIVLKALEYTFSKSRVIVMNVLDNNFWQSIFKKAHYFKKRKTKVNHYLTVRMHNEKLESRMFLDKEHWFLMNGDIL